MDVGGTFLAQTVSKGTAPSMSLNYNAATNRIAASYSFEPLHPSAGEPVTTAQNRTKLVTYYRDETTALDYADQRHYYRVIGRFLTADPYVGRDAARNPGEWNRYAYVAGDPVNFWDPSGLLMEVPGTSLGQPPWPGFGTPEDFLVGDDFANYRDWDSGGGRATEDTDDPKGPSDGPRYHPGRRQVERGKGSLRDARQAVAAG